jgi:hypothetical protein
MKYALVPVEQLEKLEEARKELCGLCDSTNLPYPYISNISSVMWYLSNRRWKTIKDVLY